MVAPLFSTEYLNNIVLMRHSFPVDSPVTFFILFVKALSKKYRFLKYNVELLALQEKFPGG